MKLNFLKNGSYIKNVKANEVKTKNTHTHTYLQNMSTPHWSKAVLLHAIEVLEGGGV
jgi:hypothetical protein